MVWQGVSAGTEKLFEVFSSEWFKVMYYLLIFAKFGFQFFFWIQEKNVKFKWIRLTIRQSVLSQTQNTFVAHTSDTSVIRLIVWLTGVNYPGKSAVCPCWFTCTFYPVFHKGFGPISFGKQNNGFCLFRRSSRVNIALARDQKTNFAKLVSYTINQASCWMLKWVSQNISRREKLQTHHTSWALIDWLTKRLILQNPFFDQGQEFFWH